MAMVGRKHVALNTPAVEVSDITGAIVDLSQRMEITLARMSGLALAAPQVGRSLRVVVTKPGAGWREAVHVVNPTLVETSGRLIPDVEGCLSLPGRWYEVERYETCVVTAVGLDGDEFTFEASSLEARMWQHEIDHLNGLILYGRYPEVRLPT